MKTKVKYFLPLILVISMLGLAACATTSTQVTKEGTGLMLMKTWDDLSATYVIETTMPNLSEEFKEMLRIKREMLIGSYYAIVMYNEYIETGFVTAQTLGNLYAKYIDEVEVPFEELVAVYEAYIVTKELDDVFFEQIINIMLARLTSMALSGI